MNKVCRGRSLCLPVIKSFFVLLIFLSGCNTSKLNPAKKYAKQSQAYYQQAVDSYKQLIARGRDTDKGHLDLGLLYYNHGDFNSAIEEFKQTRQAHLRGGTGEKYLAIAYFRTGNFTDALDIFNRDSLLDDEARYYQGLTCEKLNLFDSSLDAYCNITSGKWRELASQRINLIEKQINPKLISELDPQISTIINSAPSQEKYPQAGAFILWCDEKVEITDSDTRVTELHYVVKILNERGKQEFSEASVDYDSTYEKVELEYARTIKPDGTVLDVGSRHIRDVSKYLNFPLYSNVRVYIISFPEISEGAVVEYKLKIMRNKLINKNDFVLSYPLQTNQPVISARFTVSLPESKALNIKLVNEKYNSFGAVLKPRIEQETNRRIYYWEFKDIPQIIPESNMPPVEEINPSIILSTFSQWQDIYNWWWDLAKDKIKADEAIKDKVRTLTEKLKSDEEKVRAIYNFCAKEIRYVAVEYGQAGYEPHSAADIFKNKYGDCKDQAVLLVTMLKDAGFNACPALIPSKDCYDLDADFPSILFDHCIASVLVNENMVFLDPTAQTCSFGDLPAQDQNRGVLVFLDKEYKIARTPMFSAGHNVLKQDIAIKLSSDESISVRKTIFTSGNYDQSQRYWLLYTPPKLVEEALKESIQDISIGAKLNSYKIENLPDLNKPVVLDYEFSGRDYLISAGSLRIFPQLSTIPSAIVAQEKRQYPVDFGILDVQETDYSIEIPDNFTVQYLPENMIGDSPWMSFSAEYKQENNKLYFRQKVELKNNVVSCEEYSDFKDFFEKLAKRIKQRIVLKRRK